MVRQGKYTKKKSRLDKVRWSIKRHWKWFKQLSWPKKILLISAPILLFLVITPIFTYIYFYNDIADQDRLMNRNNTGIVLKDKNDKTFYSVGRAEHRELVPLADIADSTEKALVAAEDKNFYEHGGFSPLGILRALYGNIVSQGITGGGSTLTQQLAKNTLLTTNQTVMRKYQELVIATAIENRYSKDEILEMYLNSVYFGNNSFGIEEAASNYFGKKPSELTTEESAMLIGILPAPSAYSPVEGSAKYAKQRQTYVLGRMAADGYISQSQHDEALKVELHYQEPKAISNAAPHFTEMVLNELYKKYGEEKVKRSGYHVTTTLDLGLQEAANQAVAANQAHIMAYGGSNASVVVADPKTGQIRALVGSVDYNNQQFGMVNMATSPRQPGSSFKPLYYAKALADGKIATTSVIQDEASDFNGYKPKNATRQYYGNVTVRQALDWSLNIPAVKVMQKVGISSSIDQAKAFGITTLGKSSDYGLSLALGAGEIPLTEMTGAYATLASGGTYHKQTIISEIDDKFGKPIFKFKDETSKAISAQGAYLISDILSDNSARAFMFGSDLNVLGTDYRIKKVAVKTGTTDESRDALTIGYTPNVAVGVWVGNNDNTPMVSGGSDMAGPIWKDIMRAAIGSSTPEFAKPSGIVSQSVCTPKGRMSDVFLSTYVPSGQCPTAPKPTEEKKKPEETEVDTAPNETPEDTDTDTETPVTPATPTTPTTPTVPPTQPTIPTQPTTPTP